MCAYLKNMGGYKHNQLKGRSYEEIQKLFDKAYKQVNSFVPIDSEVVKSSVTRTEGSSKRAGDELESDKSKKQKIDEHVEAKKDDDQEEAEMKKHIEIVKDDEVAIDAIPLATKPPMIVEYKIVKEGKFGYFQLIRADGSSKRYLSMIKMLQNIDREDLETLWKLVKAKHGNTRPEEDYERILWGDLKVMFEPDIKSEVWRNLQGYKVTIWKLFDTCGVHFVRKHFKTLSLDELRSPDFNLLSDQEYSEEEVAETMAETMEQYMSMPELTMDRGGSDHEYANEHTEKVLEIVDLFHIPNITIDQVMLRAFPISFTRAASHWLRNEPTGSITTWERGRSTETSNGLAAIQAQLNNLEREIKKVNEKVYAAQVGCEQCKGPHYTKDCPLKEEGKTLEEAYYTQFGGPFHGGGYRATAPGRGFGSLPSSTETNPRDQVKSVSTSIKADSNLICRIESNQYAVSTEQNNTPLYKARQTTVPFPSRLDNHYYEEEWNYGPKFTEAYGASHINNAILRKEKDPRSFTLPCFINDFCFDNALVDLGASVSVMPLSTYLNLGLGELVHTRLTVELADRTVKYPKGIAENVLVGIGKFTFPVDFIILDMPEDIKVPLILGRPFLSTTRAKIDVYKRKITLRVGEEKIIFKSVKPASSIIKRVYMLSLRERMELDLEARLMGETLVINRSLDPFLEDYIELNDLNEPFELRRNQGNDLMPTIEEGEVIEEFRTRNEDLDTGIDDYPSYCDDDKKIHIDCAHNLKFSCMIGFEFTHANFFPLLYVNMMSRKFHNSIMKNKMVYKGNNVVGALMNVPIFVGTFSVMTDFAVLENMDAYRDEGMGDVIFGEPFLREVDIKAKRFEGMITLYKGDDEVTYQMVRSHPRFKHHTNEQCNKIPPLLKVNEKDVMNGVSHAYQKLKGFYKGVLNLGPDYIRNAKTEEWLTRGHISVHELD
ncbi:putative reverse transcriptase domain-containing protein [Tanacetum coccineum]